MKILISIIYIFISIISYSQSSYEYNEIGKKFYYSSDFETALYYFNKSIELDSNNIDANFNKGSILLELKKFKESLIFYKKSAELEPYNWASYYQLGIVEIILKNYNNALNHLNKAIFAHQKHSGIYVERAMVKIELNDSIGAFIDFDSAISINPEGDEILKRGIAFRKYKNYKNALLDFNKMIETHSRFDYGAHYQRAVTYYEIGEFEKALLDINFEINNANKNQTNGSWNASHYYYRGAIYVKLNRIIEACEDFKKAIKLGININDLEFHLIKEYY